MQFREQGKKIQCIRATYNPATKRSDQKVIASFERYADKLPSGDALKDLSDQERADLEKWWAEKMQKREASRMVWSLTYAPSSIEQITKAVQSADNVSADHADKIWTALRELEKSLRKSGHPRPTRPKKAAQTALGQADLLADQQPSGAQ